jgi:hypothetical protein
MLTTRGTPPLAAYSLPTAPRANRRAPPKPATRSRCAM